MNQAGDQRRLSAVLAADVVGYTKLMEQDSEGTVAAWKIARSDIIDPTIKSYSGRIVKHTGDGFLAEFSTVENAVKCAISMQEGLSASSLDFRMGVNLGDIIDDGEDIHGEGVNIAARIEALAEPGNICISGDVYNQVRNRIDAYFVDMGRLQVKNVSSLVRVWRLVVRPEQISAPSFEIDHQDISYCSSSDGTVLAYARAGQGRPLLKTANWMTHLEFDWDSLAHGPYYQSLASRYELIRYDQRGNGLSDRYPSDITFDLIVDDFVAVAEATGLERFPIIGTSQGCAVAIAYAVRYPERVSALILTGGYCRGRSLRAGRNDDEQAKVEAMKTLIRTGWGQDNPAFRHMFTTLFIPDGTTEIMDSFDELMRVATAPSIAAQIFECNANIDISGILPRVEAPTLIFHSHQDLVSPFEEGRRLSATIPNARLVELNTPNHILIHNEPAMQRYTAETDRFLAENL